MPRRMQDQRDWHQRREAWIEQRFQAAHKRYAEWQAIQERFRDLAPKALTVLERALDEPECDPKLALLVLRMVGLDNLPAPVRPSKELLRLSLALNPELIEEEAGDA